MPIDSTFWESEKRRLMAIFLPRLTQMALTGMTNAARQAGISFDNTLYNQRAEAWARTYTDQLLADFGTTTEKIVGNAVADWISKPNQTVGDLDAALTPAFGANRANAIAVTETTRAFASGQEEAYKAEGIEEWIWSTNRDDITCPVCFPLNNRRVKIGAAFGKDKKGNDIYKPPAHPRCRCFVRPGVSKDKPKEQPKDKQEQTSGKDVSKPVVAVQVVRGQDFRNELANLDLSKFNQEFEKIVQEQDALIAKANTLKFNDPEYIDANKRIAEIENRKRVIENEKLAEQRKVLHVSDKISFEAEYVGRKKSLKQRWENGVNEFSNLVSKDLSASKVTIQGGEKRAGYYGNVVYMRNSTGVNIVVHELGHHLESSDPYVLEKAIEFYNRRTAGENSVRLSKLTGIKSYDRKKEMARKDNFINPYMGKEYLDGNGDRVATEIISMGIEYMWKDPVGFSQSDPDYFDFMIDILRRQV